MRIVFMGTPDLAVTVLRHVLDSGFDVVGAFCQPDKPRGRKCVLTPPPIKRCADEMNIEVCQPRRLGKRAAAVLAGWKPDLVIVAAYGRILPPRILSIPRFGCINVHASLLPAYRGAAPIQWAIANGETTTGVTVMQMDEGLDTGDIISQKEASISPDETAETLHDRLAECGARLLTETLPSIFSGEATATPQLSADATDARILTREDGLIRWEWDALTISNRARGFHSWPGTFTRFRGRQLKIYPRLTVLSSEHSAPPGEILEVGREGTTVACGLNALLLSDVQLQGKRRMPSFDFANGARLKRGETLG